MRPCCSCSSAGGMVSTTDARRRAIARLGRRPQAIRVEFPACTRNHPLVALLWLMMTLVVVGNRKENDDALADLDRNHAARARRGGGARLVATPPCATGRWSV